MSAFDVAILALLPAFAIPVVAALRGASPQRFAAVQLTTTIAAVLLALLTFPNDEPSFIDLAITVEVLALPAALLYARFFERWV